MFNLWKKKDIENIRKLEEELNKLRDKTSASVLSFVGTSEKIKGLNLVCSAEENFNYKLFAGIIADLFQRTAALKQEFFKEDLELHLIEGIQKGLIVSPITNSVVFVGFLSNKRNIKYIYDWLEKIKQRVAPIFQY